MSEYQIEFLGEEDFLPAMEGENRSWRERHVKNGSFTTRDGICLNYYCAEQAAPKAVVVIVHGYCEFWGKYHEYAWYLWQAGYTVWFLEQRCHGYSGGKLPEPYKIHIDSFRTYAEDLKEFMDRTVLPASGDLPRLMLAHSMGGAVGALALEMWPDLFRGAVLSSPMLQMQTGSMTPPILLAVKLYMILARKQKALCPGQHPFDPTPKFSASSTLSEPRYNYLFGQRVEDVHYQTSGATFGWVMAAIDSRKQILQGADRIRIPVTIMQAGMDTLVDPTGIEDFMDRVRQTRKYLYENSKHEIFNAGTEVRTKYFRDVLSELDGMC